MVGHIQRRQQTLLAAIAVVAVLSLFAMVAGPSMPGSAGSLALSAIHSHVFSTDEAAAEHSYASHEDGAADSDVVSIDSQAADSGSAHVHVLKTPTDMIRLVTMLSLTEPNPGYSDPLSPTSETPPRLS